MTRAGWERKHRLYHPATCRRCGHPKGRVGYCGHCQSVKRERARVLAQAR